MLSSLFVSIVRTAVPALVGALAAWLLTLGVELPADVRTELGIALTTFVTVVYYMTARAVERRWPSWSWLLGSGQRPAAYSDGQLVTVDTAVLPLDDDDEGQP